MLKTPWRCIGNRPARKCNLNTKSRCFLQKVREWLVAHADPANDLLPQRLNGDDIWNAKDCAADNYPFIVLTAHVFDDYHLKQISRNLLDTEQALTNRVDGLPDTFDFANQDFLYPEIDGVRILFGASEYVKDGLMPITEWMGPTPWETRMLELLEGIWRHADTETPAGPVPTNNIEVHGELLQSMSRMYWRTGDCAVQDLDVSSGGPVSASRPTSRSRVHSSPRSRLRSDRRALRGLCDRVPRRQGAIREVSAAPARAAG